MASTTRQRTFAAFEDAAPCKPISTESHAASPAEELSSAENVSSPEDLLEQAVCAPHAPLTSEPPEPGSLAGKKIFLVDAHSLIYQVFHAMPDMTGPSGQPVGAVHGFVRDILDLIEVKGADYVIAAFDHPSKNFRYELYADYKIHRQEMPADLQPQIPVICQFLAAMGVPTITLEGFEADDVLATLARHAEIGGAECYLVTSDKDCRQLITDHVKMFNIRKNEVFDAVALQATWGIRPDQVIDFQTLVGDSVDNIPGVPLIGPKLAQELLSKYGTLESVFEHAHEVSGTKRRENLINGKEQAFRSRELVRLKTDVPLALDWKAAGLGKMRPAEVLALCQQSGFRQLTRRLESLMKKFGLPADGSGYEPASDIPPIDELDQPTAAGSTSVAGPAVPARALTNASSPEWNASYRTIATPADVQQLVAELSRQTLLSVDTETTSPCPRFAEIVGYSFAWQPGQACYIPVRAPGGQPQLDSSLVRDALRPIFENPAIKKIGQNLKYDMVVLRGVGIELRGIEFDTMVADYLLEPGERTHNMDDLARRYLGHQTITIEQLIGTGKNQKSMDQVSVDCVTQYAAEDADVPLRLMPILEPRLHEQKLETLFSELEMPLIDVLAELEYTGIRVDVARLQELSVQFDERIKQLEREIYDIAEGEFNIDSRIQLGQLLFERFKLPVLKKTKTGPSMDAEVLEELAVLHPLPAKIIDYRQNAKLKSTYVDALQEQVHPQTGRVHTSFKQDVAATGRLSSQEPNLQNIPIRTEQGRAIRSAFLPGEPDWLLMTADYSQIELRVLAHFSGDEALRQAFAEDRDIHTQVAAEVQGIPLDQVTSAMRRTAKAVNFGVIYGQSPFGLAKTLRIDQGVAAEFIDRYFARYVGVDRFMIKTLQNCRREGYVTTIAGRRRPVSGVRDPAKLADKRQRTLPERIAINTVIQGSAADIIKRAMLNVHRRLKKEQLQSRMLLQIHDELVFEFPTEEEARLRELVTQEMVAAAELTVPLKVDIKTGPNWAACET